MSHKPVHQSPLAWFAGLFMLGAGALGAYAIVLASAPRTGEQSPHSEVTIGGPFTLTDHTGRQVRDTDFHGAPSLVFFGFTYCPDVCPMTLQTIERGLALLPREDAERFQVVLISVDPERDTPEALAQYIASSGFPSNITGLTGSPEDIAAVARAYRAVYEKVEIPDSYAGYVINHSAAIYLMDEEGRFVEPLVGVEMGGMLGETGVTPASPEELAQDLERFLARTAAG